MITTLGLSFRYLELGVAAAAVVVVALLFIRRRPRGLVWAAVPAMGVLATHLFLEEGRWQMIPLYAVVFVVSIWIAVPTERPYRGGGTFGRIVVTVLVLIPALLLPVMVPIFEVPAPTGPHATGVAVVSPAAAADGESAVLHYPLSADRPSGTRNMAPYWSIDEVRAKRLPGLPGLASSHLTLVPTNSVLRGERARGTYPVVIAVPSPSSLPSDFVVLAEQLASLGWIVVETRPGAGPDEVLELLSQLASGDFDLGMDGAFDPNRVVVMTLGWAEGSDVGLPAVEVGGRDLIRVTTAGSRYALSLPDARIPPDAITNRFLIARPPRLLVGSSDVAPALLGRLITETVSELLGDGAYGSPVFAGRSVQTALARVQQRMSAVVPGIVVRPR